MSKLSKQSLEKLKEQREKLNARIQQKEARLKSSERKMDTRRKILIGSYFLDTAIKNGTFEDIKKKLDSFLTRNSDRVLFDLPELAEEKID
jgi:hypothetical protein